MTAKTLAISLVDHDGTISLCKHDSREAELVILCKWNGNFQFQPVEIENVVYFPGHPFVAENLRYM